MICNGSGAVLVLIHLRLLLRLCLLLCSLSSRAEKRDPPYPPPVDSPSLPTPWEDREDGYTKGGGGGDSFSFLWVWRLPNLTPAGVLLCVSFSVL